MQIASPPRHVPAEEQMEFPEAIAEVKNGKKVTRSSWASDDIVFMYGGMLSLRKTDGTIHNLLVSDGDVQGSDWVVVRET